MVIFKSRMACQWRSQMLVSQYPVLSEADERKRLIGDSKSSYFKKSIAPIWVLFSPGVPLLRFVILVVSCNLSLRLDILDELIEIVWRDDEHQRQNQDRCVGLISGSPVIDQFH